MAKVKSFSDLEKITGMFAVDESKFADQADMTQEDYMALVMSNPADFVGVSYDDRIKFLKENGYEVNRHNIVNADLSARAAE